MKKAHIYLLDARRGVYSEYKANRVAEIDEQMTFVQQLVEQVSTVSAQETEETDSDEIVTVQKYMQEKAEEEKESNS